MCETPLAPGKHALPMCGHLARRRDRCEYGLRRIDNWLARANILLKDDGACLLCLCCWKGACNVHQERRVGTTPPVDRLEIVTDDGHADISPILNVDGEGLASPIDNLRSNILTFIDQEMLEMFEPVTQLAQCLTIP